MRSYIKKLSVTYKRKRVKDDLLGKPVKSPQQVFELFKHMQDETREKVICLHLNHQLEILCYELVGMGTANEVLADFQGIYRGALLSCAGSLIIVHNHPSGKSNPSKGDRAVFDKLVEIGNIHGIPIHDFMIIGDDGFYSFNDQIYRE